MLSATDIIILIILMFVSNLLSLWLALLIFRKIIINTGKKIGKDIFKTMKRQLSSQKGGINKGVNAQAPGLMDIVAGIASSPQGIQMITSFLGDKMKKT